MVAESHETGGEQTRYSRHHNFIAFPAPEWVWLEPPLSSSPSSHPQADGIQANRIRFQHQPVIAAPL